jgi:hypothetical protein
VDPDRLSGGVLFALGLGTAYAASRLPFGTVHEPDAGFFPLLLAAALLALATLVILGSLTRRDPAPPLALGGGLRRVGVAVAALAGYVLALERVGYLVATLLVMLVLLQGLERIGWRRALAVALPAVVGSYYLFVRLGVPLPPGLVPL